MKLKPFVILNHGEVGHHFIFDNKLAIDYNYKLYPDAEREFDIEKIKSKEKCSINGYKVKLLKVKDDLYAIFSDNSLRKIEMCDLD